MSVEDRRKGGRLVTLHKQIHVDNYIDYYGVDNPPVLPTQSIYNMSGTSLCNILGSLNTTPTLFMTYPPNDVDRSALLLHAYILPRIKNTSSGFLFRCIVDAHGKISLLGFHQVPLDPGQIELLQTFCKNDSYDYPSSPDPSKQINMVLILLDVD